MIPKPLSNSLASAIREAENNIYKRIRNKDLSGEENITAALLEAIRNGCSHEVAEGLTVNGPFEVGARDFPKNTMEPIVGADFGITIRKFSYKNTILRKIEYKSVLVQAKLPGNTNSEKLKKQIGDMKGYTEESYVAVYDEDRVYIAHSDDVLAVNCRVKKIPKEKLQTLDVFFQDIFECRKGEKEFDARDIIDIKDIIPRRSLKLLEFIRIEEK